MIPFSDLDWRRLQRADSRPTFRNSLELAAVMRNMGLSTLLGWPNTTTCRAHTPAQRRPVRDWIRGGGSEDHSRWGGGDAYQIMRRW